MSLRLQRRSPVDDSQLPAELPARLRQIYASRGVRSADELNRTTQALLAPAGLKGLTEALDLLVTALARQQRLLVIGDFDADGATS